MDRLLCNKLMLRFFANDITFDIKGIMLFDCNILH